MTSREAPADPDPEKRDPDPPEPGTDPPEPGPYAPYPPEPGPYDPYPPGRDGAGQAGASPDWLGMLLTPEALASYEELVPGGAERVLKLAEQTARTELGIWSEDDSGLIILSMVAAMVFFGLAVGGIGTRAALIAGAFFVEVPMVIVLCMVIRWSTLRRARDAQQRGDR